MKGDGSPIVTEFLNLSGTKRYTLDVTTVRDLENSDVSILIESNNSVGVIAERPMYWNDTTAGHNTIGARR